MYFELYPGLWISDYKSYPVLKKFKINGVINLTNKKVNKSISYTLETIPRILYENSSKNIIYLISTDKHLVHIVRYLMLYAKIDECTAKQYIHSKYFI